MNKKTIGEKDVDDYIKGFPKDIQIKLSKIRMLIKGLVPEATEKVSYGMPTYKLKENLIHFAAYKNHIGLYPTPPAIEAFKFELEGYETSKGTIRFSLDKPIPYDLIERIVKYRIESVKEK